MLLDFDIHPDRFTARASGEVRWNDRLLLSDLVAAMRRSTAEEFVLDARLCSERDKGSLLGIAATAERMARSDGKSFRWVAA